MEANMDNHPVRKRATALPNSPTLLQLWDTIGLKLIQATQEQLPSKQRVVGSNPSRDALALISALSEALGPKKGNCFDKNPLICHRQLHCPTLSYQCEEF